MHITDKDQLTTGILRVLRSNSDGISEHDLLKTLAEAEPDSKDADPFKDNHSLFRAHFLLFHLLYKLRNALRANRDAELEISPLNILLRPYQPGEAGLETHDPLADYYLDLSNLENTSGQQVDEMLARFFLRLSHQDKRQEALATLGLDDPVDEDTIKQTYRRLAMQHHPDRGGDKDRLQAINAAMRILTNS
jgi:hypothetical protein